jgi:membrane fusion protein (multidrug efflux system)
MKILNPTPMYRMLSIGLLLALLSSCGGEEKSVADILASGDLTELSAKRTAIKTEEMGLAKQIEDLDAAIAKLDTVKRLPLITVLSVSAEQFDHFVELQGDVQTKNNLILYPQFAGTLSHLNVSAGDKVSKGQVLARIDDGGMSQQRAQMQLQADLAKTTFEKQQRLWEQKIGSEMQFLQAKTSYEAQQQALEQMDHQLAKTSIRAPFTGLVDEIIAERGSVVAPGQPVMRIVGLRDMYVEVEVPENYLPTIQEGKLAIVAIPVLGKEVKSEIRSVGSFINPANRTFKVQIPLLDNDASIRPNLNTKVRLNDYSNPAAVLIPQSVINEDAEGKEYVYIMRDRQGNEARAERAFVELGKQNGDRVEVSAGLSQGDEIVIEGARAIRNGQIVKIDVSKVAAKQPSNR